MDVFEAILKNKEWIFSGIGVAIIIAFAKGLRSWLKKSELKGVQFKISTDSSTTQHGATGTGHVVNVNAPITNLTVGDAVAGQPAEKKETPSTSPAIVSAPPPKQKTITAREISDALLAAPPLQKEAIAKFYIGQPIDWDGRLFTAEKMQNGRTVHVCLHCEGNTSCVCEVPLNKYPQLKVARNETPIRITGKVVGFSGFFFFTVKDAKLYF